MARLVVVRGSGIAALTCARLLSRVGWRVSLEPRWPPRPIHLLLGKTTGSLLATLWDNPHLLADAHPITERAVFWGDARSAAEMPAPGVAIAADELCRRLAAGLNLAAFPDQHPSWMIEAASPWPALDGNCQGMRCFGRRQTWIASTALRVDARSSRCIIESVKAGWVFLLPIGEGKATLQLITVRSTGDPPPIPEQVLCQTRSIRNCIGEVGSWSKPIPSMPRIYLPQGRSPYVGQPRWLPVGDAAIALDPVSGDGVGHALRGTILAVTLLQSAVSEALQETCLIRYGVILRRVMLQHLRKCLDFYRSIATHPCWNEEIAAMEEGVRFLTPAWLAYSRFAPTQAAIGSTNDPVSARDDAER